MRRAAGPWCRAPRGRSAWCSRPRLALACCTSRRPAGGRSSCRRASPSSPLDRTSRRPAAGPFFFQAEDGIRYVAVTGVQTCALPIYTTQASKEIADWMHKILSPYLTQFEPASVNRVQRELIRRRCRPAWKLFIETLLLCSPLVVARNWHRRWRGRYPVLILTHHLVTDRIHPMGISTEIFRSGEHTSELQSPLPLVRRLFLGKKKKTGDRS